MSLSKELSQNNHLLTAFILLNLLDSLGGWLVNPIFADVSLQALSTDSIERLPVYNKTALKNYKVCQEADDWCVPSKEPLDLRKYKVA